MPNSNSSSNSPNLDPKIRSLIQRMHFELNDAISDHPGFLKAIENILAAGVKPELYMVVELSLLDGSDTGVRDIEPIHAPKMSKKDIKAYDERLLRQMRIKI